MAHAGSVPAYGLVVGVAANFHGRCMGPFWLVLVLLRIHRARYGLVLFINETPIFRQSLLSSNILCFGL